MQVVIELFDLLVLAQHLYVLHLLINHLIKAFNYLFSELLSKLIAREVTQALAHQPHMHIGE